MVYKQGGVQFRGTENRSKPAGIQAYFKIHDSKWKGYHLTNADDGYLLLPPDFEVIEDMAEMIDNVS